MKRFGSRVLTLFLSLFFLFSSTVFSQAIDFNKAYADYVYSTDLYNSAYSSYQIARSSYMSLKTLASKEKAKEATLKMLQARDELIKTYLIAIKLKIAETEDVPSSERNLRNSQLDAEINWFAGHKSRLTSAGTLEDLVADSNEAMEHYTETEYAIYQSLGTIVFTQLDTERANIERVVGDLRAKAAEIRAKGDKDMSGVDRWIIEVDNRITRSRQKKDEAKSIMDGMKLDDEGKKEVYDEAKVKLIESHAYLKEAITLLKQIIIMIKTAD